MIKSYTVIDLEQYKVATSYVKLFAMKITYNNCDFSLTATISAIQRTYIAIKKSPNKLPAVSK